MGKRVQFQEKINIQTIENRHDITEKEKSEAWYDRNELDLLLKLSIRRDGCKRGLENIYSRWGYSHRARVTKIVLKEQTRQKIYKMEDSTLLAALYFNETMPSRLLAVKMGEIDFKSAYDVYVILLQHKKIGHISDGDTHIMQGS